MCSLPIGPVDGDKAGAVRLAGLGGGWFLSASIGNILMGIFASVVSAETGLTTTSALSGDVQLLGPGGFGGRPVPNLCVQRLMHGVI